MGTRLPGIKSLRILNTNKEIIGFKSNKVNLIELKRIKNKAVRMLDDLSETCIYIYIYIYLGSITIVHKRVLNYHIYIGGKSKIIT